MDLHNNEVGRSYMRRNFDKGKHDADICEAIREIATTAHFVKFRRRSPGAAQPRGTPIFSKNEVPFRSGDPRELVVLLIPPAFRSRRPWRPILDYRVGRLPNAARPRVARLAGLCAIRVGVAVSSCGARTDVCGSDGFDGAAWAAADASDRRVIAQCGVDTRTFVGWSPSRACLELGKPYTAREGVWRWSLGPDDVGFRVVALELKFDRADRVETAGVADAGEPETPGPLGRRVRAACAVQPQAPGSATSAATW